MNRYSNMERHADLDIIYIYRYLSLSNYLYLHLSWSIYFSNILEKVQEKILGWWHYGRWGGTVCMCVCVYGSVWNGGSDWAAERSTERLWKHTTDVAEGEGWSSSAAIANSKCRPKATHTNTRPAMITNSNSNNNSKKKRLGVKSVSCQEWWCSHV